MGFVWSSAYVQSELLGIANQTPLPPTRPQAPKKMALTRKDLQKAAFNSTAFGKSIIKKGLPFSVRCCRHGWMGWDSPRRA